MNLRTKQIAKCAIHLERIAVVLERFDERIKSIVEIGDMIGRVEDLEKYVPTIDVLIDWMRDETKEKLEEQCVKVYGPDDPYDPEDDKISYQCPNCEGPGLPMKVGPQDGSYRCYDCQHVFQPVRDAHAPVDVSDFREPQASIDQQIRENEDG